LNHKAPQNIIERPVILCTRDISWVDEARLASQDAPRPNSLSDDPELSIQKHNGR
jgi:hypothetical protein